MDNIDVSQEILEKLSHLQHPDIEDRFNFWTGKTPCWEMCHCPVMIREECPAPKYQILPCWQVEGTYCKLDDYGENGDDVKICEVCRVYKKYSRNKPVELKLFGRGIDSSLKSLEQAARH